MTVPKFYDPLLEQVVVHCADSICSARSRTPREGKAMEDYVGVQVYLENIRPYVLRCAGDYLFPEYDLRVVMSIGERKFQARKWLTLPNQHWLDQKEVPADFLCELGVLGERPLLSWDHISVCRNPKYMHVSLDPDLVVEATLMLTTECFPFVQREVERFGVQRLNLRIVERYPELQGAFDNLCLKH